MKFTTWCVALAVGMVAGAAVPMAGANSPAVCVAPPSDEIRQAFKLSPFYKKCLVVEGFPIVASEKVSDFALLEAHYVIGQMLAGRNDILRAMAKNNVRLAILAPNEFTCDIPEHADLTPANYWNRRARGLGATPQRPAVSCGEENLLGLEGDPYSTESIMVHEFAHAIHEMGLNSVDPTFDDRLNAAYQEALRNGRWKNTYASRNRMEYWAECVQSWFHCNRTHDKEHNHVNSRHDLQEHDPRAAALLAEVFRNNEWRYVPPAQRKMAPHLAGFNRQQAPKFAWPANLAEVKIKPENRPEKEAVAPPAKNGNSAVPKTDRKKGNQK